MLSAISRPSTCTRSIISNLFKNPPVARTWYPTSQLRQFSQRIPTSPSRAAPNPCFRAFSTSHCKGNASNKNSGNSASTSHHPSTTSSSTGSPSIPTAQANSAEEQPGIERKCDTKKKSECRIELAQFNQNETQKVASQQRYVSSSCRLK